MDKGQKEGNGDRINSLHGQLPESHRQARLENPFLPKRCIHLQAIWHLFQSWSTHCLLESRIIAEAHCTQLRCFGNSDMPLHFIKAPRHQSICIAPTGDQPLYPDAYVFLRYKNAYTQTLGNHVGGLPSKVPHNVASHTHQQSPTNTSTCSVEKN